jgi:hypothetical protein
MRVFLCLTFSIRWGRTFAAFALGAKRYGHLQPEIHVAGFAHQIADGAIAPACAAFHHGSSWKPKSMRK